VLSEVFMNKIKMEIIGKDLNDGHGFPSYQEVLDKIDKTDPPYGKVFRVNGLDVKLIKICNKPVFDIYRGGKNG